MYLYLMEICFGGLRNTVIISKMLGKDWLEIYSNPVKILKGIYNPHLYIYSYQMEIYSYQMEIYSYLLEIYSYLLENYSYQMEIYSYQMEIYSYLLDSSELGVREPGPDGCCGLENYIYDFFWINPNSENWF